MDSLKGEVPSAHLFHHSANGRALYPLSIASRPWHKQVLVQNQGHTILVYVPHAAVHSDYCVPPPRPPPTNPVRFHILPISERKLLKPQVPRCQDQVPILRNFMLPEESRVWAKF